MKKIHFDFVDESVNTYMRSGEYRGVH